MIFAAVIAGLLAESLIRFLVNDPARPEIVAESSDRSASLSIHLLKAETAEMGPAIFSKVGRGEKEIWLQPQIPLSQGASYRAILRLGNGKSHEASYRVPESVASKPRVMRIEPSSAVIPANLLKFYLYFDQPMREGRQIFDQVTLIHESGEPVHAPWRRQEMWNSDATRLTLLIHPGRIKQGVNLREELGPVLSSQSEYQLMIDSGVKSAQGIRLGEVVTHNFRTGPECYAILNPGDWELVLPSIDSKEPLVIHPNRFVDHALAAHQIRILDGTHEVFAATVRALEHTGRVEVTPRIAWQDADYFLEVGELLEDLAGNTRVRVFDTDLSKAEPKPGLSHLKFHPTSSS